MDICWPQADLFNTNGNKICRHYAGPHWESTDDIKIAGTVKKSADALQADHILVASCDEVCRLAGSFSKTTSIERVNTVGA
jgi:hypothetical protein